MVIIKQSSQLPDNFTGKIYNKDIFSFFKNKKQHRYYGPQFLFKKIYKCWWFDDEYFGNSLNDYNQKQFFKELNNQWLL